ncbi:MAG: hybrid sensor histidine kinase/response regulator transcription factor [Winogradskyella sp.]|jgi:signal transduction histidine kinase/ligand-binding sensor domain-containing protein/AraC-like DNA-binding protein
MTNFITICSLRLSNTNLSLLLCLVSLIASAQNLTFSHYGLDEGLPQETIHCIEKDANGFIWLGTSDGVVRFDGQDFFVPQQDLNSGLDIAGYRIGTLTSKDNYLYVGTGQNGLIRYNLKTETITQFGEPNSNCTRLIKYDDKIITTFYDNGIAVIDEHHDFYSNNFQKDIPEKITGIAAKNNTIFVGTDEGHIYKVILSDLNNSGYDFSYELIAKFETPINNLEYLNDYLWAITSEGVLKYSEHTKSFSEIPIIEDGLHSKYNINTMAYANSSYYIGTRSNGLLVSEFNSNQFKVKQHFIADKKYDASTINSDGINELFINDNLLFIGNINLDITAIEAQDVFKQPTDNFNLDNPSVFAVYDTEDFLFTGSSSGLVISSNNDNSKFNVLTHHNRVRGITRDDENNIWFVTNKGAFIIPLKNLDIENPTIIKCPIDANNPTQLPAENMRSVYKDLSGNIWVTTFNAGFSKFIGNVTSNDLRFKTYNSKDLASVFTLSMVEDATKNYWMSTQKGLSKLNFKDGELISVKNYDESSGLVTRGVLSSFIDSENTLWVASRKGLNKYDSVSDTFKSYGKREGLTNTFVYNINEDDLGNLWLSTNGGLFTFNKTTEEFTNYNPKDGVQSTEFNLGATFKNEKTGHLYFGGINGLNIFDPNRISELDKEGTLKFTSLKIKDDYILPNTSEILATSISSAEEINLNHDDFPVNLNFAALDFRPNSNINYVYKLLPDDTDWNALGSENNIQLLNLSSKSYTLQIQGKSRNDLWQKPPLQLKINVTPPWYKSNIAYLSYLLLFLGIVYAFYRISLQRQIAGQESKRLKDLDDLKSRFITNITHEFRTPLTIILGYLGNLKERFSEKDDVNTSLKTIEQNSHNLLDLVNQMLDLAKLEKGQLSVNLIQNDIVDFIRHIVESFKSIAKDKVVSLKFSATPQKVIMDFDAEKIRQIMTNLISNAIKFSPQHSELHINLNKKDASTLQIQVADQGYGIDENELPFIFDRFYQVENTEHKVSQGTGVGLALTKELVELFNGNINVTSKVNKGTTFTIHLPVTNNAATKPAAQIEREMTIGTVVPQIDDAISDDDANSVLIVEDNADMARYVASCLKPNYKVTFAKDGKEGLEIASAQIPDIIVTDVMMPIMDGFELTQKLQADANTNHIPIIMLTSKALQEDRLEGITSGADAYLTKPFQKQELQLRMQMLIAKRKQLQKRYAVNTIVEQKEEEPKPKDKNLIFLNSVIQHIQDHIDDSNFGATELAKAMAMSDSQLYRKLKAISNTSTAIFIRKVRLEKGKELLKTTDLSISEIAYAVGFNDPNYFSKTFKEEFEKSPSEFRN